MASKQTGHTLNPGFHDTAFSFGLKLKFAGKSTRTMNKIRLEHKEDGHNKFYELEIIPPAGSHQNWTVWLTYGKMNTAGSRQKESWTTEADARKFFNKKMGEKIKKGYKKV